MSTTTNNNIAKKLLAKVALVSVLASSSYAGAIIDLEVGGGVWSTGAPTGTFEADAGNGAVSFDLANQTNLTSTSDNTYLWAVLDHPIPIVPNIRIEQTTLKSVGTKTVNITNLISGDIDTTLDLSSVDYIAYWGVPFATWLPFLDELDFGIGGKFFTGSLSMKDSSGVSDPYEQSFDGATLPYGYGKVRVEPPFMFGIGLEGELKYISYSSSTFSEFMVKADWGMTAPIPAIDIEAGLEVGYRTISLDIDESELKTNVDFDGVFFGIYAKFGI